MLEQLGEVKAAEDIENAIKKVVKNDIKNLGAGKMGYGTKEVGDLIVVTYKNKMLHEGVHNLNENKG